MICFLAPKLLILFFLAPLLCLYSYIHNMAMLLLLCYFTVFTLTNCFTFQHAFSSISNKEHTLKLKHIYHHASANGPIPKLFRKYDINPSVNVMSNQDNSYSLRSKLQVVERPTASDINEFLTSDNRWRNTVRSMYLESSIGLVPDIEQRESILALAQMTNNAYLDINLNETDWYDLGPQWQVVSIRCDVSENLLKKVYTERFFWMGFGWD